MYEQYEKLEHLDWMQSLESLCNRPMNPVFF